MPLQVWQVMTEYKDLAKNNRNLVHKSYNKYLINILVFYSIRNLQACEENVKGVEKKL